MVDHTWSHFLQIHVGHHISATHHSRILLIELCHHLFKGVRSSVNVVTVETDGKLTASWIVDCQGPAAANAQVVAVGNDVHQAFIGGKFVDSLGSAVG